jgi:hypothetical protein
VTESSGFLQETARVAEERRRVPSRAPARRRLFAPASGVRRGNIALLEGRLTVGRGHGAVQRWLVTNLPVASEQSDAEARIMTSVKHLAARYYRTTCPRSPRSRPSSAACEDSKHRDSSNAGRPAHHSGHSPSRRRSVTRCRWSRAGDLDRVQISGSREQRNYIK